MKNLDKLTIDDPEELPEVVNILTPHSAEGFYARSNQFQISGPKGFMELKPGTKKNSFCVRVDMPGVSKIEDIKFWRDERHKGTVFFEAEAPVVSAYDHPETVPRKYSGSVSLPCKCCDFSVYFARFMNAGVLRLFVKKVIDLQQPCSQSKGPKVGSPSSGNQSTATGETNGSGCETEDHPFVKAGSKKAFEVIPTKEGGLYARIDMPGVTEESLRVTVENHEVKFQGQSVILKLDDKTEYNNEDVNDVRRYVGSISLLPPTSKIEGKVLHDLKDGVLRIVIPPQSA